MVEKEGTKDEEEAKKAYQAAREHSDHTAQKAIGDKVSSALIDRVDAMLQKLEKEIDDVDAKIGDRWRLLDRMFVKPNQFRMLLNWKSKREQQKKGATIDDWFCAFLIIFDHNIYLECRIKCFQSWSYIYVAGDRVIIDLLCKPFSMDEDINVKQRQNTLSLPFAFYSLQRRCLHVTMDL
ncbi:hypothetical protein V6N11_052103 [Hibiscus sabdariffa]|uniref:Uncharacterized protein n=1 Tax=Hibiscus sabdariffa TaxID=183260 RepID=A0ABR2U9H4_9ROSI